MKAELRGLAERMRGLAERMRDDAATNGDYQGAAELAALLESTQETS